MRKRTWLAILALPYVAATVPAVEPRADQLLRELYDPNGQIMVAAHRGDWRNAPENSLQAIDNAIAMGCEIIEVDLRRTSDGQFVLMHDKTLDRTTTGSGKVSHSTLAQIRRLQLKNGYGALTAHGVPTLQEALEHVDGRALLYLDKSEGQIAEVYADAKATGRARHVLFYGHDPADALRQELGGLVDSIHYLPKLGDGTDNPIAHAAGFPDAAAFVTSFAAEDSSVLASFPQLRKNHRIWASPLWPELCAGRTDDLALEDPEAAWGWLIERGATILCTDRPAALIEYLQHSGRRPSGVVASEGS